MSNSIKKEESILVAWNLCGIPHALVATSWNDCVQGNTNTHASLIWAIYMGPEHADSKTIVYLRDMVENSI